MKKDGETTESGGIEYRCPEGVPRKTFENRPSIEPPRATNRMVQVWAECEACLGWFATPQRDPRRFCSVSCCGDAAAASGKFKGVRNPRWLGGVSNDNMRYRRRAREKWPTHESARRKVAYAVKYGHLEKRPCVECGNPDSNGHHEDYDRPLDVVWLCRGCHDAEHARIKAG